MARPRGPAPPLHPPPGRSLIREHLAPVGPCRLLPTHGHPRRVGLARRAPARVGRATSARRAWSRPRELAGRGGGPRARLRPGDRRVVRPLAPRREADPGLSDAHRARSAAAPSYSPVVAVLSASGVPVPGLASDQPDGTPVVARLTDHERVALANAHDLLPADDPGRDAITTVLDQARTRQ